VPGYYIGAPSFGTMYVSPLDAVDLTFSRLDSDPSDGWNTSINSPDDYSNVTTLELCTAAPSDDICGTYDSICRVLVDGVGEVGGSIFEVFSYRGPAG
jgi:hypothetical protein